MTGAHSGAAGASSCSGSTRAHVRGDGGLDLLGVWQPEVVHVAHEVLLVRSASDAWIVTDLFAHRARGAPLVVVGGVDHASFGQVEQLLSNGAKECVGIAALKVRATRAAHEQCIAREHQLVIVRDEGEAASGVPRRGACFQRVLAKPDHAPVFQGKVHVLRFVHARDADLGTELCFHQPGPRDVVGMAMRVEHVAQLSSSSRISAASRV